MLETEDLVLRKARFEDWEDLYHNIWSREESARYMLWQVTNSEEEARDRIQRTIKFQRENKTAWIICEKQSGKAIGFVGMKPIGEGLYEDCGLAIGPEFVGRGYGKQILNAVKHYVLEDLGADNILVSCRSGNAASRGLILSCGFTFVRSEERTDPRDHTEYLIEFYALDPARLRA